MKETRFSIQVGKILGTPIMLRPSHLLMILFLTYIFSTYEITLIGLPLGFGEMGIHPITKYVLGMITAVLFSSCIVLYHVVQSHIAKKHGVKTHIIVLHLFGGMLLTDKFSNPKTDAKIAVAGPITMLVIGILCFVICNISSK